MQEKALESTNCSGSKCSLNGESSFAVKWSFETNWIIAHGSLENSVTIDSSDYPFVEPDLDKSARKSPLVLKPRRFESSPCEIKIFFGKNIDVGQIYVRSTARVYEIYYTNSPRNYNEYLCTVRCGAAERDEKLLQTCGIEYDAEEHVDCYLGEPPEDIVGANSVSSDDDWVNIKVPKVRRNSSSNDTNTNRVRSVQDLYEATAEISDADPCSSLTIRFLSLQNKSIVYVDEVYVFVDPVEFTDSETAATAGSLNGSSLMAMLVPALLQGVSRVNDTHASHRVLKDDKLEIGLQRIDEIGGGSAKNPSVLQNVKLLDAAESVEIRQTTSPPITVKSVESIVKIDGAGVGLAGVDQQSVKLQERDNNTSESAEPLQPTSALNTVPIVASDSQTERVERALEHLITRVSRVEDICLRFEEKLLRPIESIESRLQYLENQLEKLTKNSLHTDIPGCTRIFAPAFSCSESNSSSFCDDRSDYPPSGASDFEKKKNLCDNMSNFIPDAKFLPSLVVSAPEFSCGEDDEENGDSKRLKDTTCVKPQQILSIDDALAAALSGFMSSTKTNSSDCIQTSSGPFCEADEKILHCDNAEPCQNIARGFPAAGNGRRASSQFTQILSITAPEFTVEESSDEEHLKCTHSFSATASIFRNKEEDNSDEMTSPGIQSKNLFASADFREFDGNESMYGFQSAYNGSFRAVSDSPRIHIVDMDLSGDVEIFGLNNNGAGSIEGDIYCDFVEDRDLTETEKYKICDETNTRETFTDSLDNKDIVIKQMLELDMENLPDVSERCSKNDLLHISESSHSAIVDFEHPILDVEFISDDYTRTTSPLEALLVGVSESSIESHSIHYTVDDDENACQINVDIMNGNEKTNLLRSNFPLVDLGASSADGSSSFESLHNLFSPPNSEMIVSLI